MTELSTILSSFFNGSVNTAGSENDSSYLFHSFFISLIELYGKATDEACRWATNVIEGSGTTAKNRRQVEVKVHNERRRLRCWKAREQIHDETDY
jgi:hypothetical protein